MLVWLLVSIGVLVAFVGLLVLSGVAEYKGWYEFDAPAGAAVGFVFTFMAALSLTICICSYPRYYRHYNKYVCDIVSLKVDNSYQGSFFLGTGSLNNKTYYVYYSKCDKGYKLDKLETSESFIVETSEITPSIYHVKETKTLSDYYNIYVPEGTIITTFVLN